MVILELIHAHELRPSPVVLVDLSAPAGMVRCKSDRSTSAFIRTRPTEWQPLDSSFGDAFERGLPAKLIVGDSR